MDTRVFGAPLDITSLPVRAVSHTVQATFLGLLSPQLPDAFCCFSIRTRVASSSRLHVVELLSLKFPIQVVLFVAETLEGDAR